MMVYLSTRWQFAEYECIKKVHPHIQQYLYIGGESYQNENNILFGILSI